MEEGAWAFQDWGFVMPTPPCASDSGEAGDSPLASFLVPLFNDISEHFCFSSEGRPVALGRDEGPDFGAGWCQLLGADWPEVVVPCILYYSHAALTVYICFIVYRFVNIIA